MSQYFPGIEYRYSCSAATPAKESAPTKERARRGHTAADCFSCCLIAEFVQAVASAQLRSILRSGFTVDESQKDGGEQQDNPDAFAISRSQNRPLKISTSIPVTTITSVRT
ncbi:hypothetical protein [Paraburkholderia youngii]|uniref:hypothetical protein n=1 Tax=Paraburkholderia youngii TaxID=2782701 RepID=UPI0015951804|nr:hypothetical protein [Paraburkholderia youngii]